MANMEVARKALVEEWNQLRVRAERIVKLIDNIDQLSGDKANRKELELLEIPQIGIGKGVAKKSAKAPSSSVSKKSAPAKKVTSKTAAKAPSAKKSSASALPDTGGTWFIDILTDAPMSRAQFMEAAIKKAGGSKLSAEDRKKMAGRVSFALNSLTSQEKINTKKTETGLMFSRK